jgi:hypothetical protein
MRQWLTTVLLMLVAVCGANGAELACDWRPTGGPYSVEWVEAGELWGVRLGAANPKWKLQQSWHSNTMSCETCAEDQIRFAHLWLGLGNPAKRDVDKEVSPEFFAHMMMGLHMPPAEYRAKSDSQPVMIAGLEGKARKIGIRSPDGRSYEAIAVSASHGCVRLLAVASARGSREVPLDRLAALSSAIDIQWYGPRPDPCPPDPRPPEDIPLLERLQSRTGCPPVPDSLSTFANPQP